MLSLERLIERLAIDLIMQIVRDSLTKINILIQLKSMLNLLCNIRRENWYLINKNNLCKLFLYFSRN